jgi:hypothetical protein
MIDPRDGLLLATHRCLEVGMSREQILAIARGGEAG